MAQVTTKPATKKRVDWDRDYLPEVKSQLSDFESVGIKPTFRGMYYSLIELGILAKTESNYRANLLCDRGHEYGEKILELHFMVWLKRYAIHALPGFSDFVYFAVIL